MKTVAAYENTGIENSKLGMALFLASEVMFFTGLIGAYIVLRFAATSWPVASTVLNVPLTFLNTFFLMASTVTIAGAVTNAQKDELRKMRTGIVLTLVFGILFLVIQAHEYFVLVSEKHFTPSTNLFASCFYALTGFHGLHVLAGVAVLLFTWKPRALETFALYWYFVDVVWLILFAIIYII